MLMGVKYFTCGSPGLGEGRREPVLQACPTRGKRGRLGLHLPEAGRMLVGTALKWLQS